MVAAISVSNPTHPVVVDLTQRSVRPLTGVPPAETHRAGHIGFSVQSPSDTHFPHELVNAGLLERHPSLAFGRCGCLPLDQQDSRRRSQVPQPGVRGVDQVTVGALPVRGLPPRVNTGHRGWPGLWAASTRCRCDADVSFQPGLCCETLADVSTKTAAMCPQLAGHMSATDAAF